MAAAWAAWAHSALVLVAAGAVTAVAAAGADVRVQSRGGGRGSHGGGARVRVVTGQQGRGHEDSWPPPDSGRYPSYPSRPGDDAVGDIGFEFPLTYDSAGRRPQHVLQHIVPPLEYPAHLDDSVADVNDDDVDSHESKHEQGPRHATSKPVHAGDTVRHGSMVPVQDQRNYLVRFEEEAQDYSPHHQSVRSRASNHRAPPESYPYHSQPAPAPQRFIIINYHYHYPVAVKSEQEVASEVTNSVEEQRVTSWGAEPEPTSIAPSSDSEPPMGDGVATTTETVDAGDLETYLGANLTDSEDTVKEQDGSSSTTTAAVTPKRALASSTTKHRRTSRQPMKPQSQSSSSKQHKQGRAQQSQPQHPADPKQPGRKRCFFIVREHKVQKYKETAC